MICYHVNNANPRVQAMGLMAEAQDRLSRKSEDYGETWAKMERARRYLWDSTPRRERLECYHYAD